MTRAALLLLAVILVGCGSGAPAASGDGATICAAAASLEGNAADFKTVSTASTPSEAYAAMDRMVTRTNSAIDSLRAVPGGPIGDQARALADIEQGLIPIIGMFRDAASQASWTAARDAYTNWYNASSTAIPPITSRLIDLGVRCQ